MPTDTIVYMHGSLDLMHPGWIDRLREAKAHGDFLYVGVWDDDMLRYYRGENYPIQPLQPLQLQHFLQPLQSSSLQQGAKHLIPAL